MKRQRRATCVVLHAARAEVVDIKLTKCDACDLVRYCSDKCQEDHRSSLLHKQECKERADELRDEILFRKPESRDLGETARSVVYRYRLIQNNLHSRHAAAKQSVTVVIILRYKTPVRRISDTRMPFLPKSTKIGGRTHEEYHEEIRSE
jgi:hypothetical protein